MEKLAEIARRSEHGPLRCVSADCKCDQLSIAAMTSKFGIAAMNSNFGEMFLDAKHKADPK